MFESILVRIVSRRLTAAARVRDATALNGYTEIRAFWVPWRAVLSIHVSRPHLPADPSAHAALPPPIQLLTSLASSLCLAAKIRNTHIPEPRSRKLAADLVQIVEASFPGPELRSIHHRSAEHRAPQARGASGGGSSVSPAALLRGESDAESFEVVFALTA